MTNSPIAIFCFNRPHHLERVLQALMKCPEAATAKFFFFCDGPRNTDDQPQVSQVHNVVKKFSALLDAEVELHDKNQGLAKSIIAGTTKVLKKYETVINIEDDILVFEDFLRYMNAVLDLHRSNKLITSVSGYVLPIKTAHLPGHTFLLPRASSWGWGTWADRWFDVKWDEPDKRRFLGNRMLQRAFNQWAGQDMAPMMKKQLTGKIDSWLVRWSYYHFKTRTYCLYPKKSHALNIGIDGSGTHSPRSDKYRPMSFGSLKNPANLEKNPLVDDIALQSFHEFVKPSIVRKAINFFTLPR